MVYYYLFSFFLYLCKVLFQVFLNLKVILHLAKLTKNIVTELP